VRFAGEAADALDERDAVLAEEEVDPLVELLDHLLGAPEGGRIIARDLTDDDAELLGPTRLLEEFRALEERLARNAAPVQARPADLVLLDDSDLQAELGSANRCDVAAGPSTEEYDVELLALFDGHPVLLRFATDEDPPPANRRLSVGSIAGKSGRTAMSAARCR
jgi:hypothetical protein